MIVCAIRPHRHGARVEHGDYDRFNPFNPTCSHDCLWTETCVGQLLNLSDTWNLITHGPALQVHPQQFPSNAAALSVDEQGALAMFS